MLFPELVAAFFLLLLPLLSILFLTRASTPKKQSSPPPSATVSPPRSYPIIGSFLAVLANQDRRLQWLSDILQVSSSATYVLHRSVGTRQVLTANPAVVQHILKTNFHNYGKGDFFNGTLKDFLGHGIFNVDGESWKFQRQVASHEFNTKSLRKFVETVVDTEISDRLVPILSSAAATGTVLDFQDILQRFAFDNICKIAFGFDPAYLLPSLPQTKFAQAFDESVKISSERLGALIPLVWKIKKLLNIGSEKRLRIAVSEVQEFSRKIIREKNHELRQKKFVTDIVISFILAGRDTTSSALTWYLWLLSKNPHVESEVLKEIKEKSEAPVFDEVKDMMYTHASLCESMRLYPPVAADTKEAVNDDVLPDGTVVKKGMRVTYIPYAMGRLETLWGSDWAEFKPERWLEKDEAENSHWRFVGRDAYTYPVFQAGPRICLGKEMAFLQMKRVLAGVLRRFKVVPALEEGVEPEFVPQMTSRMKGGLPVRIVERDEKE